MSFRSETAIKSSYDVVTPFLSYLFTLLGYIPCWVLPCLSVANDSATSVIKKQVLEKKEEKEEV